MHGLDVAWHSKHVANASVGEKIQTQVTTEGVIWPFWKLFADSEPGRFIEPSISVCCGDETHGLVRFVAIFLISGINWF